MTLAAVVAGTLAGCGVSIGGDSGSDTDAPETGGVSNVQESSTDGSPEVPPAAVTAAPGKGSSDAGSYSGDVKSLLTPPGATVVASSSGELVLTSSDSVSSLVTFYEGALDQLGAQRNEAGNSGSGWGYDGTYGDGQSIEIAVVDATGMRNISISY